MREGNLHLDVARADRDRHEHGVSWVYERLAELTASDVIVRTHLVRALSRGHAVGVTRPNWDGDALPGREYQRIPGPVAEIAVDAATHQCRTRACPTLLPRTSLEIGATLVHEMVVHTWRDASFYQPPAGRGYRAASRLSEARHRAQGHAGFAADTTPHNLADAEDDLLELYYVLELERRGDPAVFDGAHARTARQLGVMGTPVRRWQDSSEALRRAASELRRERLRFLEQRVLFEQHVLRAQREARARR